MNTEENAHIITTYLRDFVRLHNKNAENAEKQMDDLMNRCKTFEEKQEIIELLMKKKIE
jgi:hypothetical protein